MHDAVIKMRPPIPGDKINKTQGIKTILHSRPVEVWLVHYHSKATQKQCQGNACRYWNQVFQVQLIFHFLYANVPRIVTRSIWLVSNKPHEVSILYPKLSRWDVSNIIISINHTHIQQVKPLAPVIGPCILPQPNFL